MAKKKSTKTTTPAPIDIRSRVKEMRMVKASQLMANPKNWRTHSKEQMAAVKSMLQQVGFAGAELARELEDGSLQLIDGHARAKASGDSEIPVLILDVTEQEADTILSTYDVLGSMAGTDAKKLNQLLDNVRVQDEALTELLGAMAYVPDEQKESEEATKILEGQSEALTKFIEMRKKSQARGIDKAEQNFYVGMVFQSWEQKQEFLRHMPDVPTLYGMWVDGQTLAQKLNIPITANTQPPILNPLDKKLQEMALTPPNATVAVAVTPKPTKKPRKTKET